VISRGGKHRDNVDDGDENADDNDEAHDAARALAAHRRALKKVCVHDR
jgi:hypothetical protein